LQVKTGFVDFVRLGRHRAFTRVSINYAEGKEPNYVLPEVLCKEDSVAIRLAFSETPFPETSGKVDFSPEETEPPVNAGLEDGSLEEPQAAESQTPGALGPTPGIPPEEAPINPPAPQDPKPTVIQQDAQAGNVYSAVDTLSQGEGDKNPEAPLELASTSTIEDQLCNRSGPGRGRFGVASAKTEETGLFVVTLPLESEEGPGAVSIGHSLGAAGSKVTYVDFSGTFRVTSYDLALRDGPVRLVRFGVHQGYTRVSLNYFNDKAPKIAPLTEVLCLENAVEIRVTFPGTGEPPQSEEPQVLLASLNEETSETSSAEPVLIPVVPSKDSTETEPGAVEPPIAQLEEPQLEEPRAPDPEPVEPPIEQLEEPGAPEPDPVETLEEPVASELELEAEPEPEVPLRTDWLNGQFVSCAGTGDGSGSFGVFTVDNTDPQVFLIELPLADSLGPGAITINQSLSRRSSAVSYLDIKGRYSIAKYNEFLQEGPIRLVRLGSHGGFTRVSLNWREGMVPEDVNILTLCSQGLIRIRVTPQYAQAAPVVEPPLSLSAEENSSREEPLIEANPQEPSEAELKTQAPEPATNPQEEASNGSTPELVIVDADEPEPEAEPLPEATYELTLADTDVPEPEVTLAPCEGRGSGRGNFGAFTWKEEADGSFVLTVPFSGNLGRTKFRNSVKRTTGNVTFVDITGSYRAKVNDERFTGGPVGRVRFGYHEGHIRLSINWRDSHAPSQVKGEILCSEGFITLRLTPEYQQNED
jgi:hypothetical protein